MPWYVEYDFRSFNLGKPERKLLELNCPNNLGSRKKAVIQAAKEVQELDLQNPQLVWKEKIPETKRR